MSPASQAEHFLLMKKHNRGLRGLSLSALAMTLLAALPAWAVDPFTLRDIRVEGLQRVEPGTIFASLPFRIGGIRQAKHDFQQGRAERFGHPQFRRGEARGDTLHDLRPCLKRCAARYRPGDRHGAAVAPATVQLRRGAEARNSE